MKIILVNKFSGLEGEVGGATRYILELFDLLRSKGHEVAFFSTLHPVEKVTARDEAMKPWKNYWVSNVNTKRVEFTWQGIRTAFRFLWSFEAARNLKQLIDDFEPDVIHLNSFSQQLSPSILKTIKNSGVPMVMTVHDYELVYPDYALKLHQWEDCLMGHYFSVVTKKAVKGSLIASFWKWLQFTLHKRIGLYRKIDMFLCPSVFMKNVLEYHHFHPCHVLLNCIQHNSSPDDYQRTATPSTILMFGRMTSEKGVLELIEAYSIAYHELGETMPHLVLVGNGMRTELSALIESRGLTSRVVMLPFEGKEPNVEYANARFVVVPSFPYLENYPYAVLNAFQMKKPVLSSGLGGMSEMVVEGKTGWNVLGSSEIVVRSEYVRRLARVLVLAVRTSDKEIGQMGERGFEYVSRLTPDWYYGELMKIYNRVIRGNPKLQIPISK